MIWQTAILSAGPVWLAPQRDWTGFPPPLLASTLMLLGYRHCDRRHGCWWHPRAVVFGHLACQQHWCADWAAGKAVCRPGGMLAAEASDATLSGFAASPLNSLAQTRIRLLGCLGAVVGCRGRRASQIAAWSSSMRKRGALAERTLTAGQAGPGESRWWLTLYVSRPPPVTVIRNDAVVHLHGSGNHNVGGGHDRRWAVGTAAALLSRVATKAMRTPCFGHLSLLPANHSKDDMARPMVPPRTRRPQPGARPVTPLPTD